MRPNHTPLITVLPMLTHGVSLVQCLTALRFSRFTPLTLFFFARRYTLRGKVHTGDKHADK